MLFVLKPMKFCLPEQREEYSNNLPMRQRKFSYELTFLFISIKNGGKQKKVKISLRVENNQFCDG